jgi:hypothetical protein
MGGFLPAIMTTLVFTGVFTYFIIRADIDAIRGDWANRRCELPVILLAGLAKPSDNPQTPMEFSKENFSFCTSQLVDTVLKTAFAPLYAITGQQVNALDTMTGPMNSFRMMLKRARDSLGRLLDKQYRQYIAINGALLKTWQHLLFSMGRIQAVFTSVVYFGLSASALVQNTLQFTYKAILAFIGIMVAMIILLFFVLFPFIPLIMTMITILVAAGFGAAAGMSGAFCIDPDADVKMKDSTTKKLRDIRVGDILWSDDMTVAENRITGVLTADATTTPLVEIEGVLMSESHRVLLDDKWILAKDHPYRLQCPDIRLPTLICLNTTTHSVPIQTETGSILHVGDWEEVSDEAGRQTWIDMVFARLNTTEDKPVQYPTQVPLASPTTTVFHADIGPVPMHTIQIGDSILTQKKQRTRVIGIYKGRVQLPKECVGNPEWITDGVWLRTDAQAWTTAGRVGVSEEGECEDVDGMFLITEDEQFLLVHKGVPYLVRDFTEIGASHLDTTYEALDRCMNSSYKK